MQNSLTKEFLESAINKINSNSSGFTRHYLTLFSIILGLEAKKVFEFGSGFSSQVILEALRQTGGTLTSCDMRPIEGTGNSKEELEKNPNWIYLEGNSLEKLKQLKDSGFDVVLHDGSHEWRVVYRDLRNIIKRIKKNGLLLVHDTYPNKFRLLNATKLALLFTRHEIVTLPYGYGLTIVRILSDFGHGEISTTWQKIKS